MIHDDRTNKVSLCQTEIKIIMEKIKYGSSSSEMDCLLGKMKATDGLLERNSVNMFELEDAAQSLPQVKSEAVSDSEKHAHKWFGKDMTRASFFSKRSHERLFGSPNDATGQGRSERIKEMKADSKCRACGQLGHWFRDHKDFLDRMMKTDHNMRNLEMAASVKYDSPPDVNDQQRHVTFFRNGGQ